MKVHIHTGSVSTVERWYDPSFGWVVARRRESGDLATAYYLGGVPKSEAASFADEVANDPRELQED